MNIKLHFVLSELILMKEQWNYKGLKSVDSSDCKDSSRFISLRCVGFCGYNIDWLCSFDDVLTDCLCCLWLRIWLSAIFPICLFIVKVFFYQNSVKALNTNSGKWQKGKSIKVEKKMKTSLVLSEWISVIFIPL